MSDLGCCNRCGKYTVGSGRLAQDSGCGIILVCPNCDAGSSDVYNAAVPGRSSDVTPDAGTGWPGGIKIRESRESRLTAPGTAPVHINITRP